MYFFYHITHTKLHQVFRSKSAADVSWDNYILYYSRSVTCTKYVTYTEAMSHELNICATKCRSPQRSCTAGVNLTLIIGNWSLRWDIVGDKLCRLEPTAWEMAIKIDNPKRTMSTRDSYVWWKVLTGSTCSPPAWDHLPQWLALINSRTADRLTFLLHIMTTLTTLTNTLKLTC